MFQVTFRTTGNGTVRFNPNLYNLGKVGLSIVCKTRWFKHCHRSVNPAYLGGSSGGAVERRDINHHSGVGKDAINKDDNETVDVVGAHIHPLR